MRPADNLIPTGVRPPHWATTGDERIVPLPNDGSPENAAANSRRVWGRLDIAFGWPMLSFRGGVTEISGEADEYEFGPELAPIKFVFIDAGNTPVLCNEPRTIPLEPILPGVVLNTLGFGVAWTLLFAPGVIRRSRRRWRGACVKCGYDRRGLGNAACPECGVPANVIQ